MFHQCPMICSARSPFPLLLEKSLLSFLFVLLSFNVIFGHTYFTDQYVLQIPGGPEQARLASEKHGFIYLGHIFGDFHHLRHSRVAKRSISPADEFHHRNLTTEPEVRSLSQQRLLRRVKRDFIPISLRSREGSLKPRFDDPKWPQMWYLNRGNGLDMNVQKVWDANITGRGVVVTILDDGLEKDHPDLIANYDPLASYDVNNQDADPMPRYDMLDSNRHGTRCAGEVAANAENSVCAVGVAYHSRVGGVRMLDGDVTDAVEARSLSLQSQYIHIYSASWGPDDDGKTVDGPGELATRAFIEGVTRGRAGLGSIFIWASGNGGREHDNCNCDGYTNSIWTLSISSATENGLVPWYSEACSSTLAATYSSGAYGEKQIITTDLHHSCTSSHTGTSASAPIAAGIAALALQAKLTWRDMQHLVVMTAKPMNLNALDWRRNGVGRNVSHSFGYGLMDAHAMVTMAKDWVTVPSQKICEIRSDPLEKMGKMIPAKSTVELSLHVRCDKVRFLEHVQARLTLNASKRGEIHIYLTSPSGTRSTLVAPRPMDKSRAGFQNWPFMTVHNWGEDPNGKWKLEIHNELKYYNGANFPTLLGRAYLKEWTLILYGTQENPDRRKIRAPLSFPSVNKSPQSTQLPDSQYANANKTTTNTSSQNVTSPTSKSLIPTSQDFQPPYSRNPLHMIHYPANGLRHPTSSSSSSSRPRPNRPPPSPPIPIITNSHGLNPILERTNSIEADHEISLPPYIQPDKGHSIAYHGVRAHKLDSPPPPPSPSLPARSSFAFSGSSSRSDLKPIVRPPLSRLVITPKPDRTTPSAPRFDRFPTSSNDFEDDGVGGGGGGNGVDGGGGGGGTSSLHEMPPVFDMFPIFSSAANQCQSSLICLLMSSSSLWWLFYLL